MIKIGKNVQNETAWCFPFFSGPFSPGSESDQLNHWIRTPRRIRTRNTARPIADKIHLLPYFRPVWIFYSYLIQHLLKSRQYYEMTTKPKYRHITRQCSLSTAVLWIRIRMLLDLPDPSLFVRIWILPSSSKNSKKILDFSGFATFLWLFIFEEWKNVPSKHKKQKLWDLEGHWRKEQDPVPNTDPWVSWTDPRIRIHTKMSRIHNTGPR